MQRPDSTPALKFVPEGLLGKTVVCSRCSATYLPDWLKPRPPMGSVEGQDGYWVRLSVQERCPACSALTEIALPVRERKAAMPFFGDEAVRQLDDQGGLLFTYSLIGTSKPFMAEFEGQIRDLKRQLRPALSPDQWKIHMSVLWSGQQRRKRPEFEGWEKAQTDALIAGLGAILDRGGDKLFKYNIVLAGRPIDDTDRERFEKYVQQEAYVLLVMHVIDTVTGLGGQPHLQFDAQKPVKGNTAIHQWARDAFQNGQGNLLYSFLSHSIFVPEPLFVQPASHPLLEVADFMSFAVARHHYRLCRRRDPEIDLKVLGPVSYMAISEDGNEMLFQESTGYPWRLDFSACRI